MKYVIVSASHRKDSQSEKVARFLSKRLMIETSGAEVTILSLGDNPIPLWDEEVWAKADKWQEIWKPFSEKLKNADAFIFVVPEWAGMVPPAFKNFLLLCTSELRYKPALICGVSSGMGGSYPMVELRISGYKNTFINYLPEHLIIRHVTDVLNEDVVNMKYDEEKLRDRIDNTMKLLEGYAEAFTYLRNNTKADLAKYSFGM